MSSKVPNERFGICNPELRINRNYNPLLKIDQLTWGKPYNPVLAQKVLQSPSLYMLDALI